MRNVFVLIIVVILIFMPSAGKDIIALKSDDNSGDLVYPGKVEEGPNGNIYVADYKDYYIKVYSPEGKYLRRIGGKGEGPGEMKRMGSFGFAKDKKSLFFTEFFGGHRWITFIDLNGNFKKIFKLNIPGMYGILEGVMLSEDRFLLRINDSCYSNNMIEKKSNYFYYRIPQKLTIINNKGELEKEIIYRKYFSSISMVNNGADLTLPFRPKFLWIYYKNKIIFSDGLSTKLKVFNCDGIQIGDIATPLPEPEIVTEEDLEKWRNSIKESSAYKRSIGAYKISGKVIELYRKSIFEKKPNISNLTLTPDENILLGGVWSSRNKSKTYWLINKKGELLCKIRLNVLDLKISRHFIFLKIMDEDDNITVNFMKRQKNEKEDLQMIEKKK